MLGSMGPLPILRKSTLVLEMLERETVIVFVSFSCCLKCLRLRSSEGLHIFVLGVQAVTKPAAILKMAFCKSSALGDTVPCS